MADSLTTLALARVLQGLGAAGLMSVNTALVRLIYPKHLLGRGIAINSLVVATASVAGPSIAAGIPLRRLMALAVRAQCALRPAVAVVGPQGLARKHAKAEGLKLSPVDVVLNALMFGLVFLGVDGLGVRIEAVPGGAAGSLWLPLAELRRASSSASSMCAASWPCPCRCFRWTCCASPCLRCPWAHR
jgi:DHA2 family multidrug resistance protein-like MFS transporter